MTEDECLCQRCARHQRTCCQTCEVYVSPGDQQRISAYTGRNDFCEFRSAGDPVYLEQDDDPIWRDHVFRADGTRRVLRRRPEGDCTFLGPAGCTLPMDVRPLVCRLYPYDYDAHGLKPVLSDGCPVQLLHPDQSLLEALDMTDPELPRQWHRHLYQEIRLEPHGPTQQSEHPCELD